MDGSVGLALSGTRVVDVIEGSSAFLSGVRAGDVVISVNGMAVTGDTVTPLIKGTAGTFALIGFSRGPATYSANLQRQRIGGGGGGSGSIFSNSLLPSSSSASSSLHSSSNISSTTSQLRDEMYSLPAHHQSLPHRPISQTIGGASLTPWQSSSSSSSNNNNNISSSAPASSSRIVPSSSSSSSSFPSSSASLNQQGGGGGAISNNNATKNSSTISPPTTTASSNHPMSISSPRSAGAMADYSVIQDLHRRLAEVSKQNEELAKYNDALHAQLQERADSSKALEAARASIDQLESMCTQWQQRNVELEAKFVETLGLLDKERKLASSAASERNEAQERLKNVSQELAQKTNQLRELEANKSTLEKQIENKDNNLQITVENLRRQNGNMSARIESLEGALEALEEQNKDLTRQNLARQEKLADLVRNREQIIKMHSNLSTQHSDLIELVKKSANKESKAAQKHAARSLHLLSMLDDWESGLHEQEQNIQQQQQQIFSQRSQVFSSSPTDSEKSTNRSSLNESELEVEGRALIEEIDNVDEDANNRSGEVV